MNMNMMSTEKGVKKRGVGGGGGAGVEGMVNMNVHSQPN